MEQNLYCLERQLETKIVKYLKYILPILYLAFLFLWFKDNFYPLQKIKLHYSIALFPLLLIIIVRLASYYRFSFPKISLPSKKFIVALIVLIILITVFRIPFLYYHFSFAKQPDAAVSALMGKHIAEGKLPPIFWYGQLYLGSLFQHLYALLFKIFGYSIFIVKFMPFLIFLVFVALQLSLLSKIYSLELSFIACLFYVVPVCHRGDWLSINGAEGFSLLLLLGVFIFYLTYSIYFQDKRHLIPVIGFLMGLALWTHQNTISFILTALIFLILKFKLQWKNYLSLFLMAAVGCFPLLLSEFFNERILFRFLFLGKKQGISFVKIKTTGKMIIDLLSYEHHPLNYSYLIFILLGLGAIIFLSLKKRKLLPQSIYGIFFVIFLFIYLSSEFSDRTRIHRYLFPLYVSLPVLLVSVFDLIKKKKKSIFPLALLLVFFLVNNLKGVLSEFAVTREHHQDYKKIVASMQNTGFKHWQGRYIRAYPLTALSKEEVLVTSFTVRKYFPYKLYHYDQKKRTNYVFLVKEEGGIGTEEATNLLQLLTCLDIPHKIQKVGLWWLIYDIDAEVFPHVTRAQIPDKIPNVLLVREKLSNQLELVFELDKKPAIAGFCLHVEIPGYSSRIKHMPLDDNQISVKIPFPHKKSFELKYYYDYHGVVVPSSEKKRSLVLSDSQYLAWKTHKRPIVYLSGFGPRGTYFDKQRTICEKNITFSIERGLKQNRNMWVYLYSPFDFRKWYWYGSFRQTVQVLQNGQFLKEIPLNDGENTIVFDLSGSREEISEEIITLKFKYALPFEFARTWKVSALLEKVEIK